MNARPDFALCPVGAKSCTHHAHCARAQLTPHPTRQAWFTPNRRGDECKQFSPIEAYTLPATENLGQLRQPTRTEAAADRKTAGESVAGNQFEADAQQERSDKHTTSATTPLRARPRPLPERGARVIGGNTKMHEPAVVPSASAGLSTEQRDQLNAARIISGRQP